MENGRLNLDLSLTLCICTCSGRGCWIYLTLDVSLLQDGFTALYFASGEGHQEVVGLLLKNGALVNKVQHCNVM